MLAKARWCEGGAPYWKMPTLPGGRSKWWRLFPKFKMATLTKANLIETVMGRLKVSRTVAETVVETFLGALIEALQNGEEIELRGFGSFRLRRRKARTARNPKQDGSQVVVPAKWIPHFKPRKLFKALLNGGDAESAGGNRG